MSPTQRFLYVLSVGLFKVTATSKHVKISSESVSNIAEHLSRDDVPGLLQGMWGV